MMEIENNIELTDEEKEFFKKYTSVTKGSEMFITAIPKNVGDFFSKIHEMICGFAEDFEHNEIDVRVTFVVKSSVKSSVEEDEKK